MLKPRFLLLLFALAMIGAVGFVWHHESTRTAESLFELAGDRLSADEPDYDAALRELDIALNLAVTGDDRDLAQEIFLLRAGTYSRRQALVEAREDFVHVRDEYLPGNVSITLQIGWIDYRSQQYNGAIAAAQAVLEQFPNHSGALYLRGRTLYKLAETTLAQCEELLDEELADEPTARGIGLAWKAAAADPRSPRRAAALSELDALVSDEGLSLELQQLIRGGTAAIVQARSSFAQALEAFPSPEAIAGLLELLQRAERPEEIVDLGLAAMVHPEFRRHAAGIEILVEALEQLERPRVAAQVIERARQDDLQIPTALLLTWCHVLYQSEDWPRLQQIARLTMKRRGGDDLADRRMSAQLYSGIAKVRLGRYEDALQALTAYTADPSPRSPFPRSLSAGYAALSEAHRALGRTQDEYRALEQAVQVGGNLSGQTWLRLSELQLKQRESLWTVANSLDNALRISPELADSIIPLWIQISSEAYERQDRRLDAVRRELRDRKLWIPERPALTWELWRLGNLHLEAGAPLGAVVAGEAILERLPDSVLGWDLVIEGHLSNHTFDQALVALVQRVTKVGPPPDSLRILKAIPPEHIQPEQMLVLMAMDPRNTGVLTMARALRANDQIELALAGLTATGVDGLQDEALLLVTELLADLEDWPAVLVLAGRVPIESPFFTRSFALRVRATVEIERRFPVTVFDTVLDNLRQATIAEPQVLLEGAQALLVHGKPALALRLLHALDRDGRTRSGEMLDALAAAHLLSDDAAGSEEALDRAEAFLVDGSPDVGRLILLLEQERWGELPGAVQDVRRSELELTPLIQAILLALEERVEEAASKAVAALETTPDDPRWFVVLAAANALLPEAERRRATSAGPYGPQTQLFAGALPGGVDPRRALLHLLAVENRTWSTWVLASLGRLGPRRVGTLWPAWLEVHARRHFDSEAARSRALLATLVKERPRFRWAWELLERVELERLGTPFARSFQNLQEARVTVLGPPADEPALYAVVRARRALRNGGVEVALEILRESLARDGDTPQVLLSLARLRMGIGQLGPAIGLWGRLFDALPHDGATGLVPEFLELCATAYTEKMITPQMWAAELEALATERPRDPAVALARARMQVTTRPQGPASGIGHAFEELELFRDETDRVPIESLRDGAAADWFEFHLEHNARAAQDFIHAELLADPGSANFWQMEARALEVQGKQAQAYERYFDLINILPDTRAMRRAGEILADRGSNHALVEATIRRVLKLEQLNKPDPSLGFLRAHSLANSGDDRKLEQGIELLGHLWRKRDAMHDDIDAAKLGFRYAASLLHRSDPADGKLARDVLASIAHTIEDPVRQDLALALANLARWVPREQQPGPQDI